MVSSINGGFPQQIPGATSFRPQDTSQPKPLDTFEQNASGRSTNAATQTQTAPGKTEEITSKTYLSRDNTRPNPNDPFASNNARGTQLDITV